MKRNKEGHYILIKGSIQEEDITIINIYGLNAPTKRQKLAEWMQKTRSLYMLSTRDPPQNKGHIQTESEGLEKDNPCK